MKTIIRLAAGLMLALAALNAASRRPAYPNKPVGPWTGVALLQGGGNMLLSNASRMVLLLAALVFCAGASAQQSSWPNQTVRLVVPAAAGGPTDLVGRGLAG